MAIDHPLSSAAHDELHHQHHLSNTSPSSATTSVVDIEAWTVASLGSLSIIAPSAAGADGIGGAPLSIPLQHHVAAAPTRGKRATVARGDGDGDPRRDSLQKREALLKGNEGSRQRRRWENARLLHVPNYEPPLPCDWQVRPTHPVHATVPYALAHQWDRGLRQRAEERRLAAAAAASAPRSKYHLHLQQRQHQQPLHHTGNKTAAATVQSTAESAMGTKAISTRAEPGRVPRALRARAERTPALRGWVRALEEPVRRFLVELGAVSATAAATATAAVPSPEDKSHAVAAGEGRKASERNSDDEADSEDEEIVFVGRDGSMRDGGGKGRRGAKQPAPPVVGSGSSNGNANNTNDDAGLGGSTWKRARREVSDRPAEAGLVLDGLGDGETGAFRRWLTHSISDYYGLDSRSANVGNPAKRVVWVGFKQPRSSQRSDREKAQAVVARPVASVGILPPPLWEVC